MVEPRTGFIDDQGVISVSLDETIRVVRDFPGITHKRDIGRIIEALAGVADFGRTVVGPGDDAAVLNAGNRYLLLAADGIVPALLKKAPYQAGRSSILVNANDIYAMGGRPIAMVNVISGLSGRILEDVLRGMNDECRRLAIPMVGGHYICSGDGLSLAVSVVGEARTVVTGSSAKAGDEIVLAIDMEGHRWGDFIFNWDSHYRKGTDQLLADLGVMVAIAEEGLCSAARDVSMGGILGTIAMMLEASSAGGRIDLDKIPVPPSYAPEDWYKVYPSYGFVITTDTVNTARCIQMFTNRGIWADSIGAVESSSMLWIHSHGETAVLYDWSRDTITGTSKSKEP